MKTANAQTPQPRRRKKQKRKGALRQAIRLEHGTEATIRPGMTLREIRQAFGEAAA